MKFLVLALIMLTVFLVFIKVVYPILFKKMEEPTKTDFKSADTDKISEPKQELKGE